jgi:hypothetical protein
VKPDSIELITPPDERYNSESPKLLLDGDVGDITIGTGQWLGYVKNDAGYFLHFNDEAKVRGITINMAQHIGRSIFPPVKLEIWGGPDKDGLKLLGVINNQVPGKDDPSHVMLEKVSFAPTSVKLLKIMVRHLEKLPEWHAQKGKPAWVFLSEIVVN